jgi:hypothetical protein
MTETWESLNEGFHRHLEEMERLRIDLNGARGHEEEAVTLKPDRREYRFEDGSLIWLTRGEHSKLMAGMGIYYNSAYGGLRYLGWLARDRVANAGGSFPITFRWQNEPGKDVEMAKEETEHEARMRAFKEQEQELLALEKVETARAGLDIASEASRVAREKGMSISDAKMYLREKARGGVWIHQDGTAERFSSHWPNHTKKGANMSKETITDAVIIGGKMAAADAAGDVLLSGAKLLLKDSPASVLLADENGQAAVKLLMGMGLVYMTQERPDLIPKSDAVGEAAGLVVTATSYTWLAPRLKQLAPMLKELSEVASFEGLAKASEQAAVEVEEEAVGEKA